jgi:hypothetical protein
MIPEWIDLPSFNLDIVSLSFLCKNILNKIENVFHYSSLLLPFPFSIFLFLFPFSFFLFCPFRERKRKNTLLNYRIQCLEVYAAQVLQSYHTQGGPKQDHQMVTDF